MQPLEAHVKNGRVVLEEPLELPENTEPKAGSPQVVDTADDFDDEERECLHRAVHAAIESVQAGLRGRPTWRKRWADSCQDPILSGRRSISLLRVANGGSDGTEVSNRTGRGHAPLVKIRTPSNNLTNGLA